MLSRYTIGDIAYGYCHCGCGRKTNIAMMTSTKNGIIKGQPYRFLLGHRTARFPIAERFWRHVDKSGGSDVCWPWVSGRNTDGYGIFRFCIHGRMHPEGAHQVAYELTYGPIPIGKEVCHTCNNRACQNPTHLYAGTHKQNVHDAIRAGRFHPPLPLYGQDHPGAKLTNDDIHLIRPHHANDIVTMTQLATRFGVCISTISNIIHRKNWPSIP